MALLHIAVRAEWEPTGDRVTGQDYAPDAFEREGFVHCSYTHQVLATAGRYYAGRDDVVLLELDEAALGARLVVEPSPSTGELFPHVYARIARSAVLAVHEFLPGPDGAFSLPQAPGGDP